jgi:hypothetical protein
MRNMSAKEKFCHMAREMVAEEETGQREYDKLTEALMDWHDEADDSPATQVALKAVARKISDVKAQERGHAVFLATVIASYCER